MSSLSYQQLNRNLLARETSANGIEMAPCTQCRNAKPKMGAPKPRCVVGPRSGRCSECIRKGRRCDATLTRPEWERLRNSRNELRSQLEKSEERVAELLQQLAAQQAKSVRLRKQLKQAESRTDVAVAQELDELEAVEDLEAALLVPGEGEGVEASSRAFFHDLLEMTPQDWGSLEGILPGDWEIPQSPPEAVL